MRIPCRHLPLVALLVASGLCGQGVVLPPGAATAEQNAAFALGEPLPGVRVPESIQIGYDPSELAGVGPQTWTSLELRPDRSGLASAQIVRLSVWLSAVGAPRPRDMSFVDRAANRGLDRVQVVRPRFVALPQVSPAAANAPPQRGIAVPFDVAYSWPGQGAAGQPLGLVVEFEWVPAGAPQPGASMFDAQRFDRGAWRLGQRELGPGCIAAGGLRIAAATSRRDEDLVLSAEYSGIGVDPAASVLFGFGGTALALDLGTLGAPGCTLGVVPAVLSAATRFTAPSATAYWSTFAVPYDPAILGVRVLSQAWMLRAGVNALGLETSETVEFVLTEAPALRRALVLGFPGGTGPAAQWSNDVVPVLTLR